MQKGIICRSILLFSVCLFPLPFYSQAVFLPAMRSLDDNHALASDTADWKWHRAIKVIHLSRKNENPYVSFGGEVREQFRYYSHLNFGDVSVNADDEDIYLQHRFLLHGDLVLNNTIRLFVQLNSCHANGRNSEMHQVDRDDLGVMQAFADVNAGKMQFRLGRQELSYGAERILALRDGPTIRQGFDGIRISLNDSRLKADVMLIQPVLYRTGIFDNTRRNKEIVFGSYLNMPLDKKTGLDLYYFNAVFQQAIFAADTATSHRQYAGLRIFKNQGAFNYETEFTWQFGRHGEDRIRAWHLSAQLSYRFLHSPGSPRFTLRESVFTGDRHPNDGEINTFRPVSAKPPVYDLVPVGPANIILLSPELEFLIAKRIVATFRFLSVNRYSLNDGMYPSDMRKMTRAREATGRHVLNGYACDLLYTPNKHISFLLYGGYFIAGNYISNTGNGLDYPSMSLRVHYKF